MRATVVSFMVNILKDDSLEAETFRGLAVVGKRIEIESVERTLGDESLLIQEHHGQSFIKAHHARPCETN